MEEDTEEEQETTKRVKALERRVKLLLGLVLLCLALGALFWFAASGSRRVAVEARAKYSASYAMEEDPPVPFRRGTLDGPEDGGVVDLSKAYVSEEARNDIREAKAIVITEYETVGKRLRPVIKEILWVAPGVRFERKVGDEFGHRIEMKPDTLYGDVRVVFCKEEVTFPNEPIREGRSVAVYYGRITYYKMRLAKFKELVAEWKKESERAGGAPGP